MKLFSGKKSACISCGKELDGDILFCPYCGTPIEKEPPKEVSQVEFTESIFLHESDKAALKALKSIPGFTTVFKAFMNVWSERQFRIQNMSSKIKLSEEQMPKYYNMLSPICEKLNIDIPELYLELNVIPNAYTYGDTKPFITITSGLLETHSR